MFHHEMQYLRVRQHVVKRLRAPHRHIREVEPNLALQNDGCPDRGILHTSGGLTFENRRGSRDPLRRTIGLLRGLERLLLVRGGSGGRIGKVGCD